MKTKLTSRIGALLIDNLAIYALGLGMFIRLQFKVETALILMSVLFIAYTILVPTLWQGYQLGKYMLGMKIVTESYAQPSFMQMLLREMSKMLYVIPFVGIGFILVSQFLMNRREDGKALHDLIAKTKVIYV